MLSIFRSNFSPMQLRVMQGGDTFLQRGLISLVLPRCSSFLAFFPKRLRVQRPLVASKAQRGLEGNELIGSLNLNRRGFSPGETNIYSKNQTLAFQLKIFTFLRSPAKFRQFYRKLDSNSQYYPSLVVIGPTALT